MFDTPHPAHKPPAPDRLAPSEARGVVTNYLAEALKTAKRVRIFVDMPEPEAGYFILMKPAEFATLRARESAPAVEREPVAFSVIYPNKVRYLQWANDAGERDDYDDFDERYGDPKQITPLYATPPSVATNCAGEVTDDRLESIGRKVTEYFDPYMDTGPLDQAHISKVRSIIREVLGLSQPARAAGEGISLAASGDDGQREFPK